MEAAKVFRAKEKVGFTRYEKRLLAVLEMDCVDEWTLQTRYNDLKARWERVQEAGDEYTATLVEVADQQAAEKWIDEIMLRFDAIELDVGQKLKLLNVATKAHEAPVVRVEKNDSIVKIDKMKFQVFDGDMKMYPEFRAEFIKHVQPQCTESQ